MDAQLETALPMSANGLNSRGPMSPEQAQQVAQEFEGVFLSMLLKEMRGTMSEGGFFGQESSDTYGGLFDLFMGKQLAESSPLGIGDLLVTQYKSSQPQGLEPSPSKEFRDGELAAKLGQGMEV